MITEILKNKTRFEHFTLEEKMNSDKIMLGDYSMDDYRRLLEMNYRFLNNFEDEVFKLIPAATAELLNIEKRRKFPLIQKDIINAGMQISDETAHEQIINSEQALGILYVMEGATLGGNVIARHLRKLPEFNGTKFNYFELYGEETGSMWKNFKNILNNYIQSPEQEAQCIYGAELAYSYLLNLSI